MKKIRTFIFYLVIMFLLVGKVDATCENKELEEELNEWATTVETEFIPSYGTVSYEKTNKEGKTEKVSGQFSYFLSINNTRDDIKMVVKDGNGDSVEATTYTMEDGKKIYGVGCFTNIEEETYIITIYQNADNCSDGLLKTMKYTVPRFNEYSYKSLCTGSDSEYCKAYTNSTKDMTFEEFEEIMEDEIRRNQPKGVLDILEEYGLYVLIPLIVVSIYYIYKIRKYRQEESER